VVDALNGGPITQNALKRRWCIFRATAGIRKELRLHDLRRALARAVYQTTGDLRQAQAVLSHSNLTSTLWYLEGALPTLDRESIAAVLAAQEEKR
jgi:site-specific recombinase XerC